MKKILKGLLCFTMCCYSVAVSAQVFAPAKGNDSQAKKQAQSAKSEQQTFPKDFFDENGAPNYVVKKFENKKKPQPTRDTEERSVYSFKVVNGEIVVDENADRNILVYYGNYKINQRFDNWISCSIRMYVLNDLQTKITSFGAKLHWPDISTTIQMNHLEPGIKNYKDIMLLGEGCLHLDKTPTIEVNRCRVKGMSQEDCANAVKWFRPR